MEEQIETVGRRRSLVIYAWVVLPVVALAALLVLTFFRPGAKQGVAPSRDDPARVGRDAPLAAVRDALARQADAAACRAAVSQVNSHLNRARAEDKPKPLSADQAARLKADFGFDDAELAEIGSPTFTPLDAAHLESCFLLRDAARSLEVAAPGGRGGKQAAPPPARVAEVAFDWVCRQVALAPPPLETAYLEELRAADDDRSKTLDPNEARALSPELYARLFAAMDKNKDGLVSEKEARDHLGEQVAPPAFVLRRGSGTALERAVVFVALLEQFGLQDEKEALQGCLLFVPGPGGRPRFWACAVVPAAEPKAAYLFDPRLGLPVPGPGGVGVATLKQAREGDVLTQLKADGLAYDVTAEQAKQATARAYAPLSALAPRLRVLQDRYLRGPSWSDERGNAHSLPPAVRVRLAEDEPGALKAVEAAFVEAGGKAQDVAPWREGGRLSRDFVGKDAGGTEVPVLFPMRQLAGFTRPNDTKAYLLPRARLLEFAQVPWIDMPPAFTDTAFAFETGLGEGIRDYFSAPFLAWMRTANSPREMVIRGQFARAAPELSKEQELWADAKGRCMDPEKARQGPEAWDDKVRKGVKSWVEQALGAYAQLPAPQLGQPRPSSPEVQKLFRWRYNEPMELLMHGAMAPGRAAELTHQLGLCKHEEAVRQQLRLERAEAAGVKTGQDESDAKAAWDRAESWWRQYLRQYDKRPGAASAARMLAEVRRGQGQPAEAAKQWAAAAARSKDGVEKLGLAWRAGRK